MSRQVPEPVAGVGFGAGAGAALTETEAPPTVTVAAVPTGAIVTPTPTTFAVPTETFAAAATELAETDAATLTPTDEEPLPADAVAVADTLGLVVAPPDVLPPVDEVPTETVTPELPEVLEPVVVPVVLEVPVVVLELPVLPEPEPLEPLEADDVVLLVAGEGPEREVRETPPTLGERAAEVTVRNGAAWGTRSGLAPDGDTGSRAGPGRMRTDTEVSRSKTISVASPNIGTMLPAGWSRTMAARLRPDLRTRSKNRASASWTGGSGGFWPRRAAWCRRRSTALR